MSGKTSFFWQLFWQVFGLAFCALFAFAGYAFTSDYVHAWWQWHIEHSQNIISPQSFDLSQLGNQLVLGYFFFLAGISFTISLVASIFQQRKIAKLKKTFPNDRWKHSISWSHRGLTDEIYEMSFMRLIWAIVTLIYLLPYFHVLVTITFDYRDPTAYLAWIPIGLWGLLVHAVIKSMRHRKFAGRCFLHLQNAPNLGEDIEGSIDTTNTIDPNTSLNIIIRCKKTIRIPGRRYSKETTILWRQERMITPEMRLLNAMRSIPFAFSLPADLPISDENPLDYPRNTWEIELHHRDRGALARFALQVRANEAQAIVG
jgi:hypothetical protein